MTHRPERFEVYTELPDGSGFTIKDCDFVFRYDRHGGWRDEDRNYYNASGEPASTPEELSSSHDDRDNGRPRLTQMMMISSRTSLASTTTRTVMMTTRKVAKSTPTRRSVTSRASTATMCSSPSIPPTSP